MQTTGWNRIILSVFTGRRCALTAMWFPASREMTKLLIRTKILGGEVWGKLICRRLIIDSDILFPEELAYEDSYWMPLLCIYAEKIYLIEEKLYHYYVNPCSTSFASAGFDHMDYLTVQLKKWAEYTRRGLMEKYYAELEYNFLSEMVGFAGKMVLMHGEQSYSYFLLDSELVKEYVADWKTNKYAGNFSPPYRLLLDGMYASLDRDSYAQIVDQAKILFLEKYNESLVY